MSEALPISIQRKLIRKVIGHQAIIVGIRVGMEIDWILFDYESFVEAYLALDHLIAPLVAGDIATADFVLRIDPSASLFSIEEMHSLRQAAISEFASVASLFMPEVVVDCNSKTIVGRCTEGTVFVDNPPIGWQSRTTTFYENLPGKFWEGQSNQGWFRRIARILKRDK